MSSPIAITSSIIVERPIMEVFDYIADPRRVAHWVPLFADTGESYTQDGRTFFRAQLTVFPFVPFRPEVQVEIIDLVPGRRISYRAADFGQTSTVDFEAISGHTLVTTTHTFWAWHTGLIAYWGRWIEPLGTDYLRHSMTAMKHHLEGQHIEIKPTIFFSYRREHARYIGGRVFDRLTSEFGVGAVFRDVDSLLAGRQWHTKIEDALARAHVVIAHIGDDWESEVRRRRDAGEVDVLVNELEIASQNHAIVIPVYTSRHEKLDLSRRQEAVVEALPPGGLKESFAAVQGIHLRSDPDFRSDSERLMRAVWDALISPDPGRSR